MEATMAGVDLGRYRRIVQLFWDPEPSNDRTSNQPVWCLGNSYGAVDIQHSIPSDNVASQKPSPSDSASIAAPENHSSTKAASTTATQLSQPIKTHQATPPTNAPETPPDSLGGSCSSSLAYEEESGPDEDRGWPQSFLDDFESKFWMTYRSEFEPIPKSSDPRSASALSLSMRIKSQLMDQNGFSSDSGWGCMIRSGQSLLANTMSLLTLGRQWRRGSAGDEERKLLAKFADDPKAPYSIHQFVKYGAAACGKYPGEWFGPSATARCIQALVNNQESNLRVYSTGDGPDVYRDSFMQIAKPDGQTFCPTLILIGTRLGIDKITPVYWEALVTALKLPQSAGIAGGRPASSHYFVGSQGQFLFYLDPHHTRPALPYYENAEKYTQDDVDSAHTRRLRRLHVREMDPSMMIGFLIQDEEDWEEWSKSVKHVQGKAVIHVADRNPLSGGMGERMGAIDEVEPLSDDDADTILGA